MEIKKIGCPFNFLIIRLYPVKYICTRGSCDLNFIYRTKYYRASTMKKLGYSPKKIDDFFGKNYTYYPQPEKMFKEESNAVKFFGTRK